MKPSARVQAAVETLCVIEQDLDQGVAHADRRLADWARGARYAGSKDRRAIADLVYQALRRRGSYLAATDAESAPPMERARFLALCALTSFATPRAAAAFFGGGQYEPKPLAGNELAQLDGLAERLEDLGFAEKDFPSALGQELARSVADPLAEILELRERSHADLRVNLLKADRANVLGRLAEEGVDAEAGPLSPAAIRLAAPVTLSQLDLYKEGWIEAQDAASQATARLANAQADEIVLDYCAGGGGKSLALAADMGPNASRAVAAYDVNQRRMADIAPRAGRAGANIEPLLKRELREFKDAADLVFVDAPCSGSGAWSRNPDAKWTTGPERLRELNALQDEALSAAAAYVRPEGRLIYVTCSIFACENQERVSAFLEGRPDFKLGDISTAWRAANLDGKPPRGPSTATGYTLIAPSLHQTDGFFVAILQRYGGVSA